MISKLAYRVQLLKFICIFKKVKIYIFIYIYIGNKKNIKKILNIQFSILKASPNEFKLIILINKMNIFFVRKVHE